MEWDLRAVSHDRSDLHTGERNQASAPQSAEPGGNERPDLIPPWAEGSYGLGRQWDPFWIVGLLSLLLGKARVTALFHPPLNLVYV